jgi:hypothetical protein
MLRFPHGHDVRFVFVFHNDTWMRKSIGLDLVFVYLFDGACAYVLNGTFNNISVTPWWSVLLMEENGGPGENHRPLASH